MEVCAANLRFVQIVPWRWLKRNNRFDLDTAVLWSRCLLSTGRPGIVFLATFGENVQSWSPYLTFHALCCESTAAKSS